jgi:hypothetical protein
MAFVVVLVAVVVAFGIGVFEGPTVTKWYASWSNGRAIKAAQALVAKAEADAKALEAARKVVAAQPAKATPTGPTGTTGAA